MSRRALGTALGLALVAVGMGFLIGNALGPNPVSTAATPVPAQSPSYPVDPPTPYAPDVAFPTLETDLAYRPAVVGAAPYDWRYRAPQGWLTSSIGDDENVWAPPDNPVGSYGLRVKLVNERKTTQQMVDQKLAALQESEEDVVVVEKTSDTLSITYRSQLENRLRLNSFRWFAAPDSAAAQFEVSVSGRPEDEPGLERLLATVSASVEKVA